MHTRAISLLLWAAVGLLGLLCWSCQGDSSQNAFPKKLPVDKRAERQQEEIRQAEQSKDNLSTWKLQRANIDTLLKATSLRYYAVRNGDGGFVAESTTYYQEEERQTPLQTKIIYLTGNYDKVYWLGDGVIWLEQGNRTYIYKNQSLVMALQDGTEIEVTENEKNDAAKVPPIARKLLQLPAVNPE